MIGQILLFLLIPHLLLALSFQEFKPYQSTLDRSTLEKRLKKYLIKDASLEKFFSISDQFFILKNEKGKEEYRLALCTECVPLKKRPVKKIAIDPGHFGGKMARLEERFIDFPSHFNEGTLTYLTAVYLKKLLEKDGYEVFITRKGIEKGAYPLNFFEWLQKNPEFVHEKSNLSKLFREKYNILDLEERAKKINQFDPDLTVVIHYNAEKEITDRNYVLTHIPGAFLKNELVEQEDRLEFLRLLVSGDLELSEAFSSIVLHEMVELLKVPSVKESDDHDYLTHASLKVRDGVYSRNLRLTRLIHSPLRYGEPLIQNNQEEARRLATCDTSIEGIPCSSRLKEVARSYYRAIKKWDR